jgi:hypothetical protein
MLVWFGWLLALLCFVGLCFLEHLAHLLELNSTTFYLLSECGILLPEKDWDLQRFPFLIQVAIVFVRWCCSVCVCVCVHVVAVIESGVYFMYL